MHPFFIYLLKAAAVLLIFLSVYWLFFRNETFFGFLRIYLLTGIMAALVVPAVNWVYYTEPVYVPVSMMQYSELPLTGSGTEIQDEPFWTLATVLFIAYVTGALGILLHRSHSILQIARLRRKAKRLEEQGLALYQVSEPLPPFSFFNHIFWNPSLYSEEERVSILRHEEAHCRQWHSIDIILMELCLIVLWWNPVSWAYRNILRQNLEYLADRSASTEGLNRTSYQFAMLRLSAPEHAPMLANTFNKSFIKKRIVMLNQKPSNPKKIGLFAVILPLLAVFMYSFNRTEVVRYVPSEIIDPLMSQVSTPEKRIEIEITATSTDAELDKIKQSLAEESIDMSYTAVKNAEGLITSLSIDVKGSYSSGKKFSGTYSIEEDGPIDPVFLLFDDEAETFSMRTGLLDTEEEIEIDVDVDTDEEGVSYRAQSITVERDDDDRQKFKIRFNGKNEGGTYFISDSSDVKVWGFRSPPSPLHPSDHVTILRGRKSPGNAKAITITGHPNPVKVMTLPLDRKSIRKLKRESKKARKNGEDDKTEYIIITDGEMGSMNFDFDMNLSGIGWDEMEEEKVREMIEKQRIEWKEQMKENETIIRKSMEEAKKVAIEARKEASEAQKEAREEQRKVIQSEKIVIREQQALAAEEARRAEREIARVVEREIYIAEGKDAMYIIDGEPASNKEFEQIAPGKIESVKVLKGKSAEALYGKDAKDGVIIVTTNK